MNLEIKHLSPYLPFDLKYASNQNFDIKISKWELKMVEHQIKIINDGKFENDYKPILRPLSDLTKEIEVNGEKFIPVEKLKSEFLFGCFFFAKSNFGWTGFISPIGNHVPIYIGNEIMDECNYYIYQKLCEWHFDLFGLIDVGLAIDINTVKF